MKLWCATGNAGKLREFRMAAEHAPVEIDLLPAYKQLPPCVEDGATFEENAVKKALHYGPHASGLLFADDSGLEVDALGGAPGVYSARFSGPHASDESNNRLLLQRMRGISHRTARFVCLLALSDPQGRIILTARDTVEGRLLRAPRGTNGFGYDPLFLISESGKTTAELPPAEKHRVSHRGKALRAMKELMRQAQLVA